MGFQQYLARQLSYPSGLIGKFVLGPLLNKRNAKLNDVTLVQLNLKEEDRVLEIGFGGGYLLERIIAQVKRGWVAGIDGSQVMVENCRTRYREKRGFQILRSERDKRNKIHVFPSRLSIQDKVWTMKKPRCRSRLFLLLGGILSGMSRNL